MNIIEAKEVMLTNAHLCLVMEVSRWPLPPQPVAEC